LRLALEGRVQLHHRFLLKRILAHIDFLEESIDAVQQEMEQHLTPFEEAVTLAQSIVGIQATAAAAIVAEIGDDMSRFPTDKHLASWAGVSPGNKQSGGRRLSGKTTSGNPYLRGMLGEVAWAIAHTKDNYLSAFYHRIARRRGKQKRSWPSPTKSSLFFIMCCERRNPTPIWELITLTSWIPHASNVTISNAWSSSATSSPLLPRRQPKTSSTEILVYFHKKIPGLCPFYG